MYTICSCSPVRGASVGTGGGGGVSGAFSTVAADFGFCSPAALEVLPPPALAPDFSFGGLGGFSGLVFSGFLALSGFSASAALLGFGGLPRRAGGLSPCEFLPCSA